MLLARYILDVSRSEEREASERDWNYPCAMAHLIAFWSEEREARKRDWNITCITVTRTTANTSEERVARERDWN